MDILPSSTAAVVAAAAAAVVMNDFVISFNNYYGVHRLMSRALSMGSPFPSIGGGTVVAADADTDLHPHTYDRGRESCNEAAMYDDNDDLNRFRTHPCWARFIFEIFR